ncbi:MAG: glycine--tRNA ligase [Thermoplasmata archaeon]|nr:glycine--tRNA ligase [Thermoplasmata archaeon]MCI4359249.1 glycine--tRNA ligase [Thermoplasmata archaeon]
MKSEELFALLRRRGYLWPSAEPYGGLQGFYDYGPLGTALKRQVEEAWATWFLGLSPDYHRIEPAEVLPEAVVRASGHLENFTDPEVRCGQCGNAFRAETVLESVRPQGLDGVPPAEIAEILASSGARCPRCGSKSLSVPRPFNLMFGLDLGAEGKERGYLRPETAQSSFLSFDRMLDVGRKAMPLGIAVVGRAYRNEIAPRQVLFRMRAFTQAELQVFFDPSGFPVDFASVSQSTIPVLRVADRDRGEGSPSSVPASDLVGAGGLPEFYVYHLAQTLRFYRESLGYPESVLRFYEKSDSERAFYNRIQFDVEVRLDSLGGYREVGAVHYRGDYDLTRHGEGSRHDPKVLLPSGVRAVPHVLEITFGVDRNLWALADLGLANADDRVLWRIPSHLAPVTVGVFPLLPKEHGAAALGVYERLLSEGLRARYDAAGTIGKRYARMDEAGTPFCVTVDGESLLNGAVRTVTLRDRDSRAQERVELDRLIETVRAAIRFPRPRRAG